MSGYFERDDASLTMRQWDETFRDGSVARTKIIDAADPSHGIDVSTVYLGIVELFGPYAPPMPYETLVFVQGRRARTRWVRYATERQARRGHWEAIAEVSTALVDPVVMHVEEPS